MTAKQIARSFWLASALAVPTLPPTPASPQVPPETEARLRSIFEARDFDARSFQATWLPDGSGYTTLEAPSGASQRELIRYDAATGTRTVLASLPHLTPPGTSDPLSISGYQFAPDGSWVLLRTRRRRQLDVRTRHLHAEQGGSRRRQHDLPGRPPNPLHPRRGPSRPRPRGQSDNPADLEHRRVRLQRPRRMEPRRNPDRLRPVRRLRGADEVHARPHRSLLSRAPAGPIREGG